MNETHENRSPDRLAWLGVGALLLCATMWSLNGPLIKLLDKEHVPDITIACYRSLFGGVLFIPFMWRRGRTIRNVRPAWPVFSVLAFTLMTAFFVKATTETAAANAIILQYTSPVWVFLLAPLLLRERLRWRDGVVLLLAMTGVAIIFCGHKVEEVPPLFYGLLSGVGYGSLTVALRGLRRVDPGTVVAINFLGSGLLLVPAVAVWGTFGLTGYQWFLVVMLSVVQMALPYLLFSWALQHVEAHRAALIVLLETVLNPVLTYLMVGEHVPPATLMGGPLILVSVVGWLVLTWRREAVAPASGR